jgi:hypothetical protein
MPKCRNCGRPIIWAKTPRGKRMPLDASPSPEGTLCLVADLISFLKSVHLEMLRGDGTPLYTSHFQTCPKRPVRKKVKPEPEVDASKNEPPF